MTARETAARIVALRRLLVLGVLLEPGSGAWLAAQRLYSRLTRQLPWRVQFQYQARIVDPATRKVAREGILAQNPGATGRGRMTD